MRKRISVHLNQRSEMLSGISHDLRTPLTRLKLQLALLNQQDLAKKMSDDIEEMERMLNEYLEFARYQKNEDTIKVNLNDLVISVTKNYKNKKIEVDANEKLVSYMRPNSIKRCLSNIIDNGFSYGNKVSVSLKKNENYLLILIDDDGPGIPEKEHLNVMKPLLCQEKYLYTQERRLLLTKVT